MARPHVLLKELESAAVAPLGREIVKVNDRKISESVLSGSLPILGMSVLNESNCKIRVDINGAEDNAIRLSPNADRPLVGIPIRDIAVVNLDAVNSIAKGEVVITVFNDAEQMLLYEQARAKGMIL